MTNIKEKILERIKKFEDEIEGVFFPCDCDQYVSYYDDLLEDIENILDKIP